MTATQASVAVGNGWTAFTMKPDGGTVIAHARAPDGTIAPVSIINSDNVVVAVSDDGEVAFNAGTSRYLGKGGRAVPLTFTDNALGTVAYQGACYEMLGQLLLRHDDAADGGAGGDDAAAPHAGEGGGPTGDASTGDAAVADGAVIDAAPPEAGANDVDGAVIDATSTSDAPPDAAPTDDGGPDGPGPGPGSQDAAVADTAADLPLADRGMVHTAVIDSASPADARPDLVSVEGGPNDASYADVANGDASADVARDATVTVDAASDNVAASDAGREDTWTGADSGCSACSMSAREGNGQKSMVLAAVMLGLIIGRRKAGVARRRSAA